MQSLRDTLKNLIQDLYGLDFDPEITPSPTNIDADYSTNAPLKLAKELHKPPMQIAEELKLEYTRMADNAFSEDTSRFSSPETYIPDDPDRFARKGGSAGGPAYDVEGEKVRPGKSMSARTRVDISQPGFMNFTLSDEYLYNAIDDYKGIIDSDEYKGKTVICEFSDPNPFKVLHVGHLYTSIVGDSIARLFEYAGANVIRANFGGDVGLHVAKTMYALLKKDTENLQIEDIAECYIEGTSAYDNDEKAKEEITNLNKDIYRINTNDEHGTPLADLYWKGRELSYEYFNQFYDSIGVEFDKYYPESTVANLGLEKVKEQLKNGVYEMSDDAVIFDGEKYGLHTRVFINREGIPTYETKDVGLIFTKWQDYHFDKSVVITGNEQLDYMKVVLKSIEQYAPDLVEKTSHLTHGLVKLPGGIKMSSRKGNFLKAVDVLSMVKDALKTEYDSEDETISLGATKYAFLKYKMGGNIIFDPHESVKMTGNSGPYLLYSAVRAKKILSKASSEESKKISRRERSRPLGQALLPPRNFLDSPERNLLKKLLEYKGVLEEAVAEMAPHKLANYLYELAQDFSRFYENCPVNGSDQEEERLKIVKVYLDTITHGLDILGIKIPEEM